MKAKIFSLSLIAIAFIIFAVPVFAAADINISLLYGYNGTAWKPLTSSSDGTLQVNPNFTTSDGIVPKTNNTYSMGGTALQWANIFSSNTSSAGDLSIYAGGAEKVTIKAGGNVGIGETNPQQALVVVGQANLTGSVIINGTTTVRGVKYNWPSADGSVANQRLTTNGAGGLSWTTLSTASANLSARNITAGSFGAEVGAGNYSFPANVSVGTNLSVSGRITDKTGFVTPVGGILPYSGALAPAGWLMANGSEVNRTTYPELFNVTGTIYGNTSDSTFKLPDLRQRIPLGKADSGTGSTLGGTGGSIDHTHTGPSHTHTYSTVIAHTHSVDPPSTASDSQGSHTHTADPASTTSSSDGAHSHSADPPSTGLSISDPGHTHAIGFNAMTNVGGGGSYSTGSYQDTLSGATGSSSTGITANNVDIGIFTFDSAGGHTHSTDVASFTTGSGGGSTHSTDIASFTSGSTGSASGTSDAGGTGATGTGNPPFLVLNYIIKY